MSAPNNTQEVPAPNADWRGTSQVDPDPRAGLAKIAKLWRPKGTLMEVVAATLCRYAHRLIDRPTGRAFSADELATDANSPVKAAIDAIDADALDLGTTDDVTHATVTATISLNTGTAGLIDGTVNIANSAGVITQLKNTGVTSNRQVNWADASGIAVVVPAYADNTAADAVLDSGDFYWNTTSNKLDQVA